MGYSKKPDRQTIPYVDIFQHHANNSEHVRKTITDMLSLCLQSRQPLPTFPLPVYCKSYNLRRRKDVRATLDELVWKRSELTGKFCGCPFWSLKARSLFDRRSAEYMKGHTPTLDDAWQLADRLSKQTATIDQRLTHEHVFPRAHLVKFFEELISPISFNLVETMLERLAMGCVILQSEHILLKPRESNVLNPWLRYKGVVSLAENPEWPDFHRQMIVEAGLVNSDVLS